MSKASAILICPAVDLRQVPQAEIDVVRRFLFDHVRGIDAQNDRRWRRLWSVLWNASAGEGVQLYHEEERSGPFHRRHRVLIDRLFAAQERFQSVDALHDWLKFKAYFITWGTGRRGQPYPIPRSTSFPECSEDEMREAHAAIVEVLHQPRTQRFLWRHLSTAQRSEMMDRVLHHREERDGQQQGGQR